MLNQQEGKPGREARIGLVFLLLLGFINYLDRAAFGVLQVPIKAELNLSDSQLGVLTGLAFFIPYSLCAVPLGRLADVWSRKYVLALGVLLWSVMTGLTGLVDSFAVLLVLRMGLAAGESAYLPASYSMLADFFAPSWRGRAIAVLALAYPIGSMLGLAGSGALATVIGWRGVFLTFGATGIVLVLIFTLVVREPAKGAHPATAAGQVADAKAPPFVRSVQILWDVRALRFMAIASGLQTYVAAIVLAWSVPFYMRVHEVSLGNVALVFAIITGIGGTVGTFAAGSVSDRLGRRNPRWYLWMPVVTCLVTAPASLLQLLVPNTAVSFVAAAFVASVVSAFAPPTFAITQSLVAPNLRALASSFLAMCISFGGALGPTVTGILSDSLSARFGPEALRLAMCTVVVPSLVAAALFARAASRLPSSITRE